MAESRSKKPEIKLTAKLTGAEDWKEWCKQKTKSSNSSKNTGGALYFAGAVGALVYWMQAAVGFGAIVTGLLKAIAWPAYIVYKLLESFYGIA